MFVVSNSSSLACSTSSFLDLTLSSCFSSFGRCFNCTSGFSLPKNVSNIEDLIAACASELPPPPVARQQNSYALDATNVNILPPTAWMSKESKGAFGLLEVPKLECCSGRCQCPPGDCSCMKDCCGCVSGSSAPSFVSGR